MAAKSPAGQDAEILSVEVYVDKKKIKDEYQVLSVEVEKQINRISRANVILVDGDTTLENFEISESADFLLGKEIEVKAGYDSSVKSIFKGVIMAQNIRMGNNKVSKLILRCKDPAVVLTVSRNNRAFDEKKDSEVITEIIKENKLSTSEAVKATTTKHPKLIQYNSTDWDFIRARAEVNGYLVIVNDGEIYVGEPKFTGSPTYVVTYGVDMIRFDGRVDSEHQLPTITANAWDMKTQKLLTDKSESFTEAKHGNLKGDTLVDVLGIKEVVLNTSSPLLKTDLKSWANGKMTKSRMSKMNGTVAFFGRPDVIIGELIQLKGLGARFNGDAYITGVTHDIQDGRWMTIVNFGLSSEWAMEQMANSGSLPTSGQLPPIHGIQNGVVKQIESDPDGEHRILVEVPTIEAPGKGKGIWARMAHLYASADIGFFFMPEVSDEVLLGFINNDPRFPVILGSLYSSKIKPPYTADKKNPTKAIVTKSLMKIEFDEEKKIILIETPGGNKITMDDDKKAITLLDANKNTVALDDKGITLKTNKDVTISAKGKIAMDCKAGLTMKCKGGDVAIEGINVGAKGKMSFKGEAPAVEVKGSATVDIQGSIVSIN
ncbi:MAG: type VI secretion system tip protein VgrG [Bacteroidota bacterium]